MGYRAIIYLGIRTGGREVCRALIRENHSTLAIDRKEPGENSGYLFAMIKLSTLKHAWVISCLGSKKNTYWELTTRGVIPGETPILKL